MDVQVVDYRAPDAPRRFVASLRATGFGVLTHHPIQQELVERIYREWLEFFQSEHKHAYAKQGGSQDGYFSMSVSEIAKGGKRRDLKEFFHIYPWGKYPAEVSPAARQYHARAGALAAELLGWIEEHSPDDVRAGFAMPLPQMIVDSPTTLLRVLHYPPLRGDEAPGALRAAAHEDINLLTLLPAASEPGLQVRDSGDRWHDVPCDFGNLVVNIGDMLQEASGGYYPSTSHRVQNPAGAARAQPRLSLPFFFQPRNEVRLSPRYLAGQYLQERLRELGLHK
ncbi:2OG-Fe(II) oxygenase family protein [Rugamonas sp.]|uniref:isopenicillin N synthase family dioxygenase n=1 Tax=Rugamonas sp. TaxID=1926287 RepID=UPI0025F19B1B|nr:2OG-Fe(II) oxygenase family protein [Rugamonas sp.]